MELKALPSSAESERAILGSVLLNPELMALVKSLIPNPAMFYSGVARTTWKAMLHADSRGHEIDMRTVQAAAEDQGSADRAGGLAYWAGLDLDVPDTSRIQIYCEVVRDRWARREGLKTCGEIAGTLHEMPRDFEGRAVCNVGELLATASKAFGDIGAGQDVGGALVPMSDLYEGYDPFQPSEEGDQGLSTGFADVDRITGGMKPGQLIILAARPGVGKTSMSMQITASVAKGGGKVVFFSLEMTQDELMNQSLSQISGMPAQSIASRNLSTSQAARVHEAVESSIEWMGRAMFDDRPRLTVSQIASSSTLENLKDPISLVVIDCLVHIRYQGPSANRIHQLGETTKELKGLAKNLGCPVLLLHHLSRKPDTEVTRPMLHHVRDSGEIEGDADMVIMPWRPSTLEPSDGDLKRLRLEDVDLERYAEIKIAKNRGGRTGTIEMSWEGSSTSFMQIDRQHAEPF